MGGSKIPKMFADVICDWPLTELCEEEPLGGVDVHEFPEHLLRPRGERLEALGRLARLLVAPGAEVGEVGVGGGVGALPGQDAEQAEEHHDPELEDVLHPVHLNNKRFALNARGKLQH